MSQASLAAQIGVGNTAISHWEAGTRYPRHNEMLAVLEVTGGSVTPNDFHGVSVA